VDRADVYYDDSDRWEFVVRDVGELSEDGDCDCRESGDGADSVDGLFWQVADSRERLYQRYQRGNSGAIAGGLALFCVRCSFDYVEICPAGEQSAYLESIELWDCGAGIFGAGDGRDAEHSVGELLAADDRDLVFGIGDHCAAEAISYHWDLCGVLYCVGVSAELDYGESVAVGGRAVDGADVSAVYIFYDYGSEDDGEVKEVAMHCGGDCGAGGDDFATGSSCVCTVLCVVSGWAYGAALRVLV